MLEISNLLVATKNRATAPKRHMPGNQVSFPRILKEDIEQVLLLSSVLVSFFCLFFK